MISCGWKMWVACGKRMILCSEHLFIYVCLWNKGWDNILEFCNNVRKEGRKRTGLAWEDSGEIYSDKLKQLRTLRALKTSTLSVVSAITLSIRFGCLPLTDRAPESSLRLSQWTPVPRWLLSGLHANYCNQTQVILILHLTPLSPESFSRCRLRWTTPPSPHTPTARLRPGSPPACSPPPPHSWRGSRLQSSASPACGSPWIWRAVMPDTNGWSTRWYPSCGGATARVRGPNRGWIPVPGDNSGGWGPPTGSPNTPSQWCCTSSLS